jgi:flavonol synthase
MKERGIPLIYKCRNANEEYSKYMVSLVDQLLEYLSMGLGLDGNVLKAASGGDGLRFLLKINYYPPCPCPELALGVPAHTDMSTITLLVPNEVQGLQVFKDDHWFNAKHIPNAIIVHIGDQIEVPESQHIAFIILNLVFDWIGYISYLA